MSRRIVIILTAMLIFTMGAFGQELTIYTYESFGWVADKMIPAFEKENNCKVNLVKFTDAGNILGRLKLEAKRPKADVVIGLTQPLAVKAKKENLLMKYQSKNIGKIKDKKYIFDKDGFVTPYDYGAIALVYDPEKVKGEFKSFEDITKIGKVIVTEDPRSSSTGQDFLLWTIAVYKDKWIDYWKKLKPSIVTVTPGWSEAFAKLESGEAPMMVSYATDGAYAYENYKSTKYKAFLPIEGSYIQVEGSAVVNKAKNAVLAKKFIDFMLEERFQNEIPLNQWMFPVTNVKLPESFKYAVVPEKILSISDKDIENNMEKWFKDWETLMKE